MDKKYTDRYKSMTDGEIIELILATPSDSRAADYLILEKYSPMLKNIYSQFYDDNYYFEDCKSELKIFLLGDDFKWKKLATIKNKECICSWLNTTATRIFERIKPQLISISNKSVPLENETLEYLSDQLQVKYDYVQDIQESLAVVLEAMTMLSENERFCILMRMKGYSQSEVAEMLCLKWEREGVKIKSKKENVDFVVPDAGYVNVCIQRAKAKISKYYNKVYIIKKSLW